MVTSGGAQSSALRRNAETADSGAPQRGRRMVNSHQPARAMARVTVDMKFVHNAPVIGTEAAHGEPFRIPQVLGSTFAEHQLPALGIDLHRVASAELAGQDASRQRVLQLLLHRALERTRAVHRIEADIAE